MTHYIVTDNNLIYATGATVDAAWAEARSNLAYAKVQLIGDDADSTECLGSWMRESNLRCLPATQKLAADVADIGGAIAWRSIDGVAMTVAEADDLGA